jgi:hypothetical protein
MVLYMKNRKAKRTKAYRENLTISLSPSVKEYVRKQKGKHKDGYSGYIESLILQDMQQQAGAQETKAVSAEEVEVRQALKERERLMEIYGSRVYDVEDVIRKGEEWVDGTGYVTIKDWRSYMEQKGIADERGYFDVYAKYCGEQSTDRGETEEFWSNIKKKFKDEKEKEHELRLKQEVALGMTLQEALDKLDAYLKLALDKKVEELIVEGEKIPIEDAYSTVERTRINERIERLRAKFEAKEVSIKDVEAALGLPYNVIYYKVVALLRREGYKFT